MPRIGTGNVFPVNHSDQSAVLKGSIEEQWKNNPQELFNYDNLNDLVQQGEIVRFHQDHAFFVITHPERARCTSKNSCLLGWKLHISVHPDDVKRAFNLAAPIISRYCSCFKVTNPEVITNERLTQGAQITIPMEAQEDEWRVTPENAEKMVKDIEQTFSGQGIRAGEKPESDAATVSTYFSMRNDKIVQLSSNETGYIPAELTGKNFNPTNSPNSYSHLLSPETQTSFDPLEHFHAFEPAWADSQNVLIEPFFILTMISYVREYTLFDSMDNKARDEFILRFCFDNGEKLDADFLKEPYRNNPEILQAVKCALSISIIQNADPCWWNDGFHHHVTQSAFSAHYPFDNSFRKFLIFLEDYSKEKMQEFTEPEKISLIDQGYIIVEKMLENCSREELVSFLQKGHFYLSQAALKQLKNNCLDERYVQILHENDSLPAVQLVLANSYDEEKSEGYYLQAMLSTASNWIKPDLEILLKHQSFAQLVALSENGNHAATFAIAVFYMRDALPNARVLFEQFTDAPIDHDLAKKCLAQLHSNPLYDSEVKHLHALLK